MMTTRFVSIRCSFLTKPGGKSFFQSWNGCSFLQYPQWAPLPNFEVSSDALGLLVRRMAPNTGLSVYQVQRTYAIVMAAYLWGPLRASKQVNFLSDNCSMVEILRSGTSRAPTIMSLGRYLSLLAARHSFSFTASPVRGRSNPIADSPSHFQFQRFRRLASHADSIPTQIPQQLLLDLELRCQINASST